MVTVVVQRPDQDEGTQVDRRAGRGADGASKRSEAPGGALARRIELNAVGGGTVVIELEENEPAWLAPTLRTLAEILQLRPDWDSYGARIIDPDAVADALTLLTETMHMHTPPPIISPTNRGGIQLEWHTRGIDLEIERTAPDRVHVFCEDDRHGTEWEGDLSVDFSRLSGYLAELARRDQELAGRSLG